MKNYLELVPISGKIHKKQNRMSIFCIILAVFLVTTIFGMADMFLRSQILSVQRDYGKWHIAIRQIEKETAEMIAMRPEIVEMAWYDVWNFHGDMGYQIFGKDAILCGSDESWITKMQVDAVKEGHFPKTSREVMITENAKTMQNIQVGDWVSISLPDGGEVELQVSGFTINASKTMEEDLYGLFFNREGFQAITQNEDTEDIYYIEFLNYGNIQKILSDIKTQFGLSEEQISENTIALGLIGQSRSVLMLEIYGSAMILFILVLMAGVFVIASSLNSNIAQRTEFFGMICCIGATPKQIMKLVHKEALHWCRYAIPIGVGAGMVVIWILCLILRLLSPIYFGEMPTFQISVPSIFAGVGMGILTVYLSARAPAKRAARVSPLTAVSGNASPLQPVKKAANTMFFKVETALGIHHAKAGKKNFFLMVGSFALCIILFLAFSVTIDFMHHSLTSLRPWKADLSIISPDHTCSLEPALLDQIKEFSAVKRVYGRMFAYSLPAFGKDKERTVDLISYEEYQLDWAKDYLLDGRVLEVSEESDTGLLVYRPQGEIEIGDFITLQTDGGMTEIEIVGILSEAPFYSEDGIETIICFEETFRHITGASGYTILDIQLNRNVSNEEVDALHRLAGGEVSFSDFRSGNQSVRGAYYAFGLFIYGFMTVIVLITVFHIVNNIAMSVAARKKQYGAYRAIGLSKRQLVRMVMAEALTYAGIGVVVGGVIGVGIHWGVFQMLVNYRWGEDWAIPFGEMGVIFGIVGLTSFLGVYGAVRGIFRMDVVELI